ncbi:MAG: hypothetical protein LUQ20_02035 [Candidatus Methanoperedens sp.]|nr:hypothetical protein [Candidatus Methanoperedens sp.]
MASEYPWYEIVNCDGELMQGDFIKGCPIIILPSEIQEKEEFEAHILKYDVIIMSQSCDLANKKINLVLLCPFWPLEDMEKKSAFFKSDEGKEQLRRGNVAGYHLLNKCELKGFKMAYQVVDFRNIYSVSLNFLSDLTMKKGERLRLLPPYREHLSQSFARFFMRVGLPVDIPAFKK